MIQNIDPTVNNLNEIVNQIIQLPPDWHQSGSVSPEILNSILKHSYSIGEVRNTAETGTGKTTLLFSHISRNHLVFALDNWKSMSVVKNSSIFLAENVSFIEGPTQKTLPVFDFDAKLDIVLLDGPHGYPFPELEYFYFYPLIRTGGLLMIDDIAIPSIYNMFSVLKADKMWHLLEVVDNFAIFQRTSADLIDPFSDSWWLQGYNENFFRRNERKQKIKKNIPDFLLNLIPKKVKKVISKIAKL